MNTEEFLQYCTYHLTGEAKRRPWTFVDHGRAILQNDEQLNAYIAAYGEMHHTKCRAALQNFPFDELTNFEVFDWGCGQGIASMTLVEMLQERGKLHGLRNITLIEPSTIALNRAKALVAQYVEERKVTCVNRPIPANENSFEMMDVMPRSTIAIHLFSNILDILTISLKWIANKVQSLNQKAYVICVGPKIRGVNRIEDFCGYFNPSEYFSKISQFPYAYTCTNHPFGCETRCFIYDARANHINTSNVERFDRNAVPFIDDYTYIAEAFKGQIPDNILRAYLLLQRWQQDDEHLFLRPYISADNPDIVLVKKGHGIMILSFCESRSQLLSVVEKTKTYRNNLFNLHMEELLGKTIEYGRYGTVVKEAVFVSGESQETIELDEDEEKATHYTSLVYRDDFLSREAFFKKVGLFWANACFEDTLYNDVIQLITQKGWHSYREGDQTFRLTQKQLELSKSAPVKRKIRGMAGAGKTQVLACRAVNAQIRTGNKVLILTFNITLLNYIKYKMKMLPADFSWGQFVITNYHQFFKSQANNFGYKPHLGDWDNVNFFEDKKDDTPKFDTVIFDEAQDYKEEWFRLIQKYFMNPDGEFVVFGDGRQNIYKRKQEEDGTPVVPNTPGAWNTLREGTRENTFRAQNEVLKVLFLSFQHNFLSHADDIEIQPTMNLFDYLIRYEALDRTAESSEICSHITSIIRDNNLEPGEVTVLASSCDVLRDLEANLIEVGFEQPKTTFEKKEQYEQLEQEYGDSFKFKLNLDSVRRVKKIHFTVDSHSMKLSTIHSFKGWESKTIILIVQSAGAITEPGYLAREDEVSPDVIYTGITRARENLFIINLGNTEFHNFFSTNIQQ